MINNNQNGHYSWNKGLNVKTLYHLLSNSGYSGSHRPRAKKKAGQNGQPFPSVWMKPKDLHTGKIGTVPVKRRVHTQVLLRADDLAGCALDAILQRHAMAFRAVHLPGLVDLGRAVADTWGESLPAVSYSLDAIDAYLASRTLRYVCCPLHNGCGRRRPHRRWSIPSTRRIPLTSAFFTTWFGSIWLLSAL